MRVGYRSTLANCIERQNFNSPGTKSFGRDLDQRICPPRYNPPGLSALPRRWGLRFLPCAGCTALKPAAYILSAVRRRSPLMSSSTSPVKKPVSNHPRTIFPSRQRNPARVGEALRPLAIQRALKPLPGAGMSLLVVSQDRADTPGSVTHFDRPSLDERLPARQRFVIVATLDDLGGRRNPPQLVELKVSIFRHRIRLRPFRLDAFYVGDCRPLELTHSSIWAAVSARLARFNKSSLSGPGGSMDACSRTSSANATSRSLSVVVCLNRRLFFITHSLYNRAVSFESRL